MEIKKDCFAYNEEKRECAALKELYCYNEECKFYKTHQKLMNDYRQMVERGSK
jgi:hypothetical protein